MLPLLLRGTYGRRRGQVPRTISVQIVAPDGAIYDATGRAVKTFPSGLPAKVAFTMPATSRWFELAVGEQRIRQSVVVPANP